MKVQSCILFIVRGIALVLLIPLLFTTCKKHAIAVDPCKDAKPFVTDFDILEQVGDSLVPTARVLKYNRIYFRAKGAYDSVKWTIANDPKVYNGKEFFLSFLEAYGAMSVNMTGYRKPNLLCFPNEKAQETITKTVFINDRDSTVEICGIYNGYTVGKETDTSTIRIQYVNIPDYQPGYYISNFPKGCFNFVPYPVRTPFAPYSGLPIDSPVGYNSFILDRLSSLYSYCAPSVSGFAQIINKDTLYIKYYEPIDITPVVKIYKGVRQ